MTDLVETARELIRNDLALAYEVVRQMSHLPAAGLTAKQLELLQFIHAYQMEHGYTPTYDEICEALDLRSKSGVNRLVVALEERGYINRIPARARSIVLRQVVA